MTLAALLLSSIAFDAAPIHNTEQVKLQGSGGIVIIKDPKPKKTQLKGSGGIVIIKDKKPK